MSKLAVVGRITSIRHIPGADFIRQAFVDCGDAGQWSGVVGLDIKPDELVTVFLQDALLPPSERWEFMERFNHRVRMARFKGVPSECVIISGAPEMPPGTDLTEVLGVTKFSKPTPVILDGETAGAFPSGVPTTDEPNFQTVHGACDLLERVDWVATLKCDGTSCTAWNDEQGTLRVANRNREFREFNSDGIGNAYWSTARQYDMSQLPAGYALQFEVIGPGIQGNPMGLTEVEGRAFTLHCFAGQVRGRESQEALEAIAKDVGMPVAQVLMRGEPGCYLTPDDLRGMANIKYANGKPAEGIVIRAIDNSFSFKVLNLEYRS